MKLRDARNQARPDPAEVRPRRARKVAVGSAVALGMTAAGAVVSPAAVGAQTCAASTHSHDGYTVSDGNYTYGFASSYQTKGANGCQDTNVSWASQPGYMRGRYVNSSGAIVWGNATVHVEYGTQSPWKVIISNLTSGRRFNHGHHLQLFATTTWRY